jgi:hypothetical protein
LFDRSYKKTPLQKAAATALNAALVSAEQSCLWMLAGFSLLFESHGWRNANAIYSASGAAATPNHRR